MSQVADNVMRSVALQADSNYVFLETRTSLCIFFKKYFWLMHSLAILTQLKNEEKETQTDDTTNDIIVRWQSFPEFLISLLPTCT